MASNTAIFYDIENLMGVFSGKTNISLHLDEIYRRVLAMDGVSGVSIQRAYADWAVPMYRNLRNSVLQVGIEPIQIFNTNQNDKVKNAADVSLIIDAVDLAARKHEIENYVIASGDGIFAFLSKKLHEHGKRVIGCSFEKIANIIFVNSCDCFITLEKTDDSIVATSTKVNSVAMPKHAVQAPAEPIVKLSKKAAKKLLQPLPKSKYTDALLAAAITVPQDLGDTAGVMNMVRQIVDSLFIEDTKDLPGLEISIFANYISHYLPNFKVRSYGFKGIAEFMRFMLSGSRYCTYSVEDNVVLMGPRAVATASNGKIVDDVNGLLIVTTEGERHNSVFNVSNGASFVYTVQKKEAAKPAQQTKPTPTNKTKKVKMKEIVPTDEKTVPPGKSNIRQVIKTGFEELFDAKALTPNEVHKLTLRDYSLKTFGVRTPIFRVYDSQKDLREQRLLNGKLKYWKEIFSFNGRQFLVYKEWTHLHKERFMKWYAGIKPKL